MGWCPNPMWRACRLWNGFQAGCGPQRDFAVELRRSSYWRGWGQSHGGSGVGWLGQLVRGDTNWRAIRVRRVVWLWLRNRVQGFYDGKRSRDLRLYGDGRRRKSARHTLI